MLWYKFANLMILYSAMRPSGLIPTFGAVDISHFRLISANTKRLFRSDQSTSLGVIGAGCGDAWC